jgi:hypothetical protein
MTPKRSVHLPQKKKTRNGDNLNTPENHQDGAVEVGLQELFSAFTISKHPMSPRPSDFEP